MHMYLLCELFLLWIVCAMARDCKGWYDSGAYTSGIYTVKPDDDEPFQVLCNCILLYLNIVHFRFTVKMHGLYFRGDKMDLLISIGTGLTMRMDLVI